MPATNSRKRAAPGASPVVPIQPPMQQPYTAGNLGGDQLMRWQAPADGAGFVDNGNAYAFTGQPPPVEAVPTSSNSLARRQNRALVATNSAVEPWAGFGEESPQNTAGDLAETDSIEALEERAQKAKRDLVARRKSIPPFIQKLSSFLEPGKGNEDLIRWSQNGESFVVLDEDAFAYKLIPELFKHNNYASFVRQLNMYGFHKRVGLSDNSMRASERTKKMPSEYSSPYFRRGHPNLLWLIRKPKGKSKKGGKNPEGDADSDDEVGQDDGPGQGPGTSAVPVGRSLPAADNQPLQKRDMTRLQEEVRQLKEQQKVIAASITRLQRNSNDYYNQSMMFQTQHDRHQNSINAILNFLANVFRKTLEDQGNTQSAHDIITSMISNQNLATPQTGSVVDLGDFFQNQGDPTTALGGPPKRARGLLPPIPDYNTREQSTASPASSATPYHPVGHPKPEMGTVTELFDGSPAETPPNLRQELESNPHERMMKIINDHNATNSSGLDLPEAAELVGNAPNTLSNDQRSQFVNFMAGQSLSPSTTPTPAPANPPSMDTGTAPSANDANPGFSLSPIMRSPPMPPPSLQAINSDQDELARLTRMQGDLSTRISNISERVSPLSPNGQIPGLGELDPYLDAPNVDLDQYFNTDAYLNDNPFGGDGNDFNFDLDANANTDGLDPGQMGGQPAAAGNTDDTPSPTGTEEIQRDDLEANGTSNGSNKRRRVD